MLQACPDHIFSLGTPLTLFDLFYLFLSECIHFVFILSLNIL